MNHLYRRLANQPKIRKLVYLVFIILFVFELTDYFNARSTVVVLEATKSDKLDATDNAQDTPVVTNKPITLKDTIEQLNLNPKVNNEHFIAETLKSLQNGQGDLLVILVQVHNRIVYLRELINSLRNVRDIDQSLVIFSHDVYDADLNDLVKSIDFCPTMQIFYPHSLQIYPHEFPGEDPNDCPRDISKADALVKKCNNAANPDRYGHYRESKIVQIKHHWFWKISFVFDELKITKNVRDLNVLLLEEDYYLLPDVIDSVKKLKEKVQKRNQVVSLSTSRSDEQVLTGSMMNKYRISTWHSPYHNTGMLVNRNVWNIIRDCSNVFCTYDDYNWDWTFQYVGQTCLSEEFESIHLSSSRVIHIGECGTHHAKENCQPTEAVKKLEKFMQENKNYFYPEKYQQYSQLDKVATKLTNSNGGWGDPRDHKLCKSFLLKYSDDNA